MTPYTASSLSNVLKERWNEQAFKKAFDLEVQGATLDTQMAMNRQLRQQVRFTGGIIQPVWVETPNPFSHTERAARQKELMQRLAIAQKKKPSYRQRQKNGRAGRK